VLITNGDSENKNRFFFPTAGLSLAIFVACAFLHASPRPAQSVTPSSPSFEVASIKPNHSNESGHRDSISRGKYIGRNVTVKSLIERAYGVSDYQLFNAPPWISSDTFDIDAKVEDSLADTMQKLSPAERTNQIKLIFQSLLADRFGLKITHETKDLPIYALVVAKNGPKLTPTKLPPLGSGTAAQQSQRGTDVTGKGPESKAVAVGVTITQLVAILARAPELAGRVVLDETGIKGEYDFTLDWTRDDLSVNEDSSSPSAPAKGASSPSLFTALQQQLGLKLESKKGPVDTIVIDHVERPSEN
jgi:uncharacterized protein (TIGR03435 family)